MPRGGLKTGTVVTAMIVVEKQIIEKKKENFRGNGKSFHLPPFWSREVLPSSSPVIAAGIFIASSLTAYHLPRRYGEIECVE
jgi:hypothetical protein